MFVVNDDDAIVFGKAVESLKILCQSLNAIDVKSDCLIVVSTQAQIIYHKLMQVKLYTQKGTGDMSAGKGGC